MLFVASIKNLKTLKHISWKKRLALSIFCSKRGNEDKEKFKEEELIEILKLIITIEGYQKILNYFKDRND